MELNEARTRTATLRLESAGFLRFTMLPGAEETLADAQENIRASNSLLGGQPRPILVDLRRIKEQDRDARLHYMGPEAQQGVKAAALLVEGQISTMIGNFVILVTKPSIPTRLFTSEAEAIAWLQGFLS